MERDLSAWKPEDATWMAARKRGWKAVRNSLTRHLYVTDKSDLELMKSYYLTGDMPPDWREELSGYDDWDPDRPMLYMSAPYAPMLYECYLHAAPSEDAWREVNERYQRLKESEYRMFWRECRKLLRRLLLEYPPTGDVFGGLDERLYTFFGTRYRPEDFPHLSKEGYISSVQGHDNFPNLDEALCKFLRSDDINPRHPVRLLVDEWTDMILPVYEYEAEIAVSRREPWFLYLQGAAAYAEFRRRCADVSHPEQVKVARAILTALEELRPRLPPQVVQGIDQGYAIAEELVRERCAKKGA